VAGPTVIGGADRGSSEQHCKAWVMEKIFYPTGGNTRFVYELNDGFKESVYRTVGGLRVKRTEDFDAVTNNITVKNYVYKKADNTSSGSVQTLPNFTWYWTGRWLTLSGGTYEYYLNETTAPGQSLSYFNGSPVVYTRVKVDETINGVSNGYAIHEFTASAATFVHENNFPYVQKQDLDWAQGLPTKETYYNSNNVIVRSVENEYDYFGDVPQFDQYSRNLIGGLLIWDDQGTPAHNLYSLRSYYLAYGRSELKKTTERDYQLNGSTYQEKIMEYTYDNQYFVMTKAKTKDSQGSNMESRLYYPFNYTTTGFSNKTAMVNANRIAEPISTENWKELSGVFYLQNAVVSDFGVFNTTMLKENKIIGVETRSPIPIGTVGGFDANQIKRHASFKDQVLISAYDSKGRFTDLQRVGQFNEALIWGVGNAFPVCTVNNAVSTDIAYTSFEVDGNGYWQNITPGNIVASPGATGNKYYQQNSFSISRSGLNSGTTYTVSYWSKSGVYSITGTQGGWPKTLWTTIVGGQTWTLYEHRVTGQTTITVTGTGAIDELRLYPVNAQMSTVAFNSLTGVTAQCDMNNDIVYYEYDSFLRLFHIRNREGQVLKRICYNYYNTREDCSGITNNPMWQYTGQVRCKVCPANASYYSDRQEREEKDMNPNSATYNTLRWVDVGTSSTCTTPADWQFFSATCELSGGVNTGNQLVVEKDMNPCSPTYNQTRNVTVVNHSTCPPPVPPGCVSCFGPDKKCINGNCETGMKVYTSSVYNPETFMYDCTYHYEFSDMSWSQDYVEQSVGECPVF
jgi:hypothetical protein